MSEDNNTEKKNSDRMDYFLSNAIINRIDIRKLMSYNQILVEFTGNGATVYGYDKDFKLVTQYTVADSGGGDDNGDRIKALAELAYCVRTFTGWDNSEKGEYRFVAGLLPNRAKAIKGQFEDLKGIVTMEQAQELYQAGYEIVKRIDPERKTHEEE